MDKVIKQIITSCPFPLLLYKTRIKYDEVRKASGIAYILIELIEKSKGSQELISTSLQKLGIPTNLHYIFGQELARLLGTKIITSKHKASAFLTPMYFNQIPIGDVSLTVKGRKMFQEGAIPTGVEKVTEKNAYFDPVRRQFSLFYAQPHADIEKSALDRSFVESIKVDISGLGDYINAHSTQMGLKAEERIVSFETDEPVWRETRKDQNLTITIRDNGVQFTFETSDENAFFNKYYNSEIMKNVMLIKKKYKFYDSDKNEVVVPTATFDGLNATNLYIPDDIQKQAIRPCMVFIGKNTLSYQRSDNVIRIIDETAAKLLDDIDCNAEFALLNKEGGKYYRALNVALPCEQFGDTFEMHLLVENQLSAEQFEKLINGIFIPHLTEPFDSENGKIILFAADVLNSSALFEKYAVYKMNEVATVDEKIGVLLKLNDSFKKSDNWKPLFTQFATSLYQQSTEEVHLDNTIYKNTVLLPLSKAMGMARMDYVVSFSRNLTSSEEPILVYQALSAVTASDSTAGFSLNEILGVANVIPRYMRAVLDNDDIVADNNLAVKFSTLKFNLWKLNGILGIEDSSDYTIADDYNVDDFFNAYATYKHSLDAINKHREYAVAEYGELNRYTEIFEPIHDLLAIERAPSSQPNKITQHYIDELLSRGKYKDAICDLLIKLQYELRKLLQAATTTFAKDLIDQAHQQEIIDETQADALHKLRMCRNSFQHPEVRQIPFDKETIVGWKNTVFEIIGDKQ